MRAATRSVDIQTFIWRDDHSGILLYEEVVRAAERGVRVRLLLDDMDTKSYDAVTAALDSHKNIEIRLFNPFWRDQSIVAAGLTDSELKFKRHVVSVDPVLEKLSV